MMPEDARFIANTRRQAEYEAERFPNDDWPVISLALLKILDESMAVAVAWDEGRRFGQIHWATNYAPEVPGKEDPNPYRTPPGRSES